MALEGTVNVPVAGKVKKSTALVVAAVVVGGGVIYLIRRHNASTSPNPVPGISSADTGSTVQTDPAGNTGTIDPATGFVVGSLQDQEALAAQSGTGFDLGGGGFVPPIGEPTAPGPGNFSDNAQWAQYAEENLTQNEHLHAATVGDAIGKYLTGRPLTADQVQVIEQAIAFAGQPPQAGPNGNPPGFVTAQPHKKPHQKPTKTVTADGKQTLGEIAAANNVTEKQVEAWNPQLAKTYAGSHKPLPRGTKVRV